MTSRISRAFGLSLYGAAVALTFTTASAVVSDGFYQGAAEGYTSISPVFFEVQAGQSDNATGTLAYKVNADGSVSVAFVQPLTLNDNTYGANSIGWSNKGHSFSNLTGSDKGHFDFTNGAGQTVMAFDLDYITAGKNGAPAVSLGVSGGDGHITLGSAANVTSWGTSLAYNLNNLGLGSYTTDSPAAHPQLDVNGKIDYSKPYIVDDPNAKNWQFAIAYEATISAAAFGATGFGGVTVPYAHDSPSKVGTNTIIVVPPPPPMIPEVPVAAPLAAVMSLVMGTAYLRRRRTV